MFSSILRVKFIKEATKPIVKILKPIIKSIADKMSDCICPLPPLTSKKVVIHKPQPQNKTRTKNDCSKNEKKFYWFIIQK
jgi:hypothetical protein